MQPDAHAPSGVWYDAVLLEIVDDVTGKSCRVRFVDYDSEVVVGLDGLLPKEDATDSRCHGDVADASAGDGCSAKSPAGAPTRGHTESPGNNPGGNMGGQHDSDAETADFVPRDLGSTATVAGLGEWEMHTRGVGSRLLAKMGYIAGQGLGKRSQGRIDIVPVTVLPPGKSLDYCVNRGKRARDPHGAAKDAAAKHRLSLRPKPSNVFEFLNDTIGRRSTGGRAPDPPAALVPVSKKRRKADDAKVCYPTAATTSGLALSRAVFPLARARGG